MAENKPLRSRMAAWWRALPLAAQLFAAISGAIGAVFAVSFIYDLWTSTRRIETLQAEAVRTLSPVLADAVEKAMIHRSRENIDELFAKLNSGHRVSVQLLDSEKRIVNTHNFASPRAPAAEPSPVSLDFPLQAKAACYRCHNVPASSNLGYLRISATRDERRSLFKDHLQSRALMAGTGALLLGIASLLIVRWLVQEPLLLVSSAMEKVKRGELATRIISPLPGEMRLIADGFNSMVNGIERDRRQILDLHRKQMAHMDRLATLGELAAQLAHEVRNPLTGLGSALQLLQQAEPPAEKKSEIISKMLAQLNRMDRTMSNFLSYARIPDPVFRPFNIEEPLNHAVFLIEPRLREQKIQLSRKIRPRLPAVHGDPAQMEQVLLNLLLNAAQAMPSGGTLTISAEANGGGNVGVIIADTGPGISPDNIDKIFQPFFTTRENGSGLGLPIAKQIVLAHSGDLNVDSRPNGGTRVTIKLPVPLNQGQAAVS